LGGDHVHGTTDIGTGICEQVPNQGTPGQYFGMHVSQDVPIMREATTLSIPQGRQALHPTSHAQYSRIIILNLHESTIDGLAMFRMKALSANPIQLLKDV
jgi:hypothetical protein